jgi:serine protease Do
MRKLIPSALVALFTLIVAATIATAQQEPPKMQPPRNPNAGWLGARFAPVSEEAMDQLKLDTEDGVLIVEVLPDTPAQAAGLQQNDVVRKIDDHDIKNTDDLRETMSQTKPGQQVKVGVWREGKMQELTVTLAKIPANIPGAPAAEREGPATGPTTKPKD